MGSNGSMATTTLDAESSWAGPILWGGPARQRLLDQSHLGSGAAWPRGVDGAEPNESSSSGASLAGHPAVSD
jgi:hypothetical protein